MNDLVPPVLNAYAIVNRETHSIIAVYLSKKLAYLNFASLHRDERQNHEIIIVNLFTQGYQNEKKDK
jgi:hypothetical protein